MTLVTLSHDTVTGPCFARVQGIHDNVLTEYFCRFGPITGCSTLLDTALDHSDLRHVSRSSDLVSRDPEIVFVTRARPRHVLAIQTTENMMTRIKWVNKAAQALIRYDLTDITEMGVVTFNNVTRTEHSMVTLDTEEQREKVADTVPGKYQLAGHNDTCLRCVMEHIVTEMLGNNTAEAHIVLVVTATEDVDVQTILKIAREARVSFLVLPLEASGLETVTGYDEVSAATSGSSVLVTHTPHEMELYYQLMSALHVTMSSGASGARPSVHTQHHMGEQEVSSGTFYSLDTEVMFRVYVPDTEDHMIKAVTFNNLDTGSVYGPYTKMSASYDLINFKTPNIVGDLPWASSGKQHWNYTVDWFPGAASTKSIIDVTSSAAPQIQLSSWISAIDSWTCPDNFQHVKISARMSSPHLSGVEVIASVEILTENGTSVPLPEVMLTSEGEEADILSTVLLSYPEAGRYSVKVRAEDLITGEVSSDPRTHVVSLASVPSVDCVPPGQVMDLGIAIFNNSDVITAQWTSPAGDLGLAGEVEMFKILVSEDVCELLDNAEGAETILSVQTRAQPGAVVEQVMQWSRDYDTLYYVAVVGMDAAGNTGRVSNIVTVMVPAPLPEDIEMEPLSSASGSLMDNYQAIIIISSSLGGVLMICLLCIVYIVISGRYRAVTKTPGGRTLTPDFTIEQSPGSQGVTDVQQILARERQTRSCHTVPVYWAGDNMMGSSMPEVHQEKIVRSPGHVNTHNYYNFDTGAAVMGTNSRYSCSSESYTDSHSNDTESYRCHSSPHYSAHSAASPPGSSLSTNEGPVFRASGQSEREVTDEGYDSTSRELELINSRKLYTIV